MKVKDYEKMKRHQEFQKGKIKEIIPSVLRIQRKLRQHEPIDVIISKHSKFREHKRNISNRVIMEVIEKGRVIEYQGNENKRDEVEECQFLEPSNEECINVIMMKKVYNEIENRMHIVHVCLNIQGNSIVVKTVYDPTTHRWRWTNGFTERVFFQESKSKLTLGLPKEYKKR